MTQGQIPGGTPPPDGEGGPAPLSPHVLPDGRTTPDPRSVTGAWYVVRGKYGGRKPKEERGKPFQPGDKPWWWLLAYHVGGKVLGVVLTLAALWLAKILGLGDEVRVLVKLILGGP